MHQEESNDCESTVDSNSGFTQRSKFLVRCVEKFTILKQRAALERPTFPVYPLQFRVPEPCFAAVLDCRTIHGMLWVLQESFLNDYLFEKDELLLSSTLPRIGQPLLKN